MTYMTEKNTIHQIVIKSFLRIFLYLLFISSVIFISAGKVSYWQGWFLIIASFVSLTAFNFALIDKKELFLERIKPGPGVKIWDRYIVLFIQLFNTILLIIGSLDAGRFHWSPPCPDYIYVISYCTFFLGYLIIICAMRTNAYFSSVVRIQADRGQQVTDTGPYKFIRHPGYTGVILYALSMPLMLGSLWAYIPSMCLVAIMVLRAYLEDKALKRELEGYLQYSLRTKYRLLPGIW